MSRAGQGTDSTGKEAPAAPDPARGPCRLLVPSRPSRPSQLPVTRVTEEPGQRGPAQGHPRRIWESNPDAPNFSVCTSL